MPRHRGRDEPRAERGVESTGWQYVLSPAAARQLRRLGAEAQKRIIDARDLLASGSPTADIRKLEGENEYRLRVGDFRAIYGVDKATKTFVVSEIADRKEAYR